MGNIVGDSVATGDGLALLDDVIAEAALDEAPVARHDQDAASADDATLTGAQKRAKLLYKLKQAKKRKASPREDDKTRMQKSCAESMDSIQKSLQMMVELLASRATPARPSATTAANESESE